MGRTRNTSRSDVGVSHGGNLGLQGDCIEPELRKSDIFLKRSLERQLFTSRVHLQRFALLDVPSQELLG
jgi:hypothetical protein